MRVAALFALVASTAACQPPCLRGHDEIRHVPEHCYMDKIMEIGDVPIWGTVCDLPHDITVFICDQYEAEKREKE